MNYLETVSGFCQKYSMLPTDGTILACVSGGADSMCLLHILCSLSVQRGFKVAAAHYNHNLRGAESDGDEAFVSEYCKRINVPLYIGSGDVSGAARDTSRGLEETARRMRYDFFYATAKSIGTCRIATAHNADDNLETVLLRIGRGTGLLGLCGIPPVRENIIRPLLCLTRQDIEEYLKENNIPHREDSSNASDDYARNRIRHHVMPVLRSSNPEVSQAAYKMARLLREDNEYLDKLTASFLNDNYSGNSIDAKALASAPFSIASRAVRHICGEGLSYEHVASVLALAESGGPSDRLSVPGLTVRREYDRLVFGAAESVTFEPRRISPGDTVIISEINAVFSCESTVLHGSIHKSLTSFLFKSEKVCGNITVRPRLPGDCIRLSEKSGTKSLKKLFIEKKIPAHTRDAVPVIADDNGPLAIPGIGCSTRVAPLQGDNVLKVTFEEIKKYD